jgi:hypothetical protein
MPRLKMVSRENNPLWEFIDGFCDNVLGGFNERWSKIRPDLFDKHIHEAMGGLLARQATLAIELARAPAIWNGNIAPLILRCMTDAHITFAWIFGNIEERSKTYIEYGLGQEKLFIEYLEEAIRENSDRDYAERLNAMVKPRKAWLNAQLAEWATDVNVGSWSGMSTRDMAKTADCESIYRFAYVPFSGAAHNMWQHVGVYNVERCRNPLHNGHLVPRIREMPSDPEFLYLAAKYVSETYELFDDKLNVSIERELPIDYFLNHPFFNAKAKHGKEDGS